jgi:hypothetical protein
MQLRTCDCGGLVPMKSSRFLDTYSLGEFVSASFSELSRTICSRRVHQRGSNA